eukprot:5751281-Pyramimonas_sp.AAC.1
MTLFFLPAACVARLAHLSPPLSNPRSRPSAATFSVTPAYLNSLAACFVVQKSVVKITDLLATVGPSTARSFFK